MTENTIDKLKGQYCKIVLKEPGKQKASVISGYLKDVDHKKNFVIIESCEGLGMVKKDNIVAIKPIKK
jgi:hypothetical protein